MNEKIPVNRLAQDVASQVGCDSSEAQQFIKDLFAYVEAEVSAGNDVTIPGLGRFSKSTLPSEPIAFEPDAEYAAELNADFEMFSPTELNEGVTEEALDAVCSSDTEESAETNVEETPSAPEEAPQTQTESEPEVSESIEPEKEDDENQPVKEEESIDEPAPVSVITELTEVETVTTEVEVAPASDASESIEVTAEAEPESQPQNEEIPPEPAPAVSQITAIPEQDEEYVIVRTRKSRFWTGFIIGLILGFALGVIAFVAYLVNISVITPEKLFN